MPDEIPQNPDISATKNQNSTQEIPAIVDIQERERLYKIKKRNFVFKLLVFGPILILLLLSPFAIRFYKEHFVRNRPVVQEVPPEDTGPKIPENIDVSKRTQYNSDLLKLSVEYPQVAKLTTNPPLEGDQIKELEIAFEKQNGQETITEENLKEGYILRISAFTIVQRTLSQEVLVKKDFFKTKCPESATISDVSKTTFNSLPAETFEINNCGADYKLTYLQKWGLLYEFAQIYKGDIGYRQVYRAATDDIMTSVKFYPEADTGPLETFTNKNPTFSFKYPKGFLSDCCEMSYPILDKAIKVVVFGDPENFIDKVNYDGIGVFIGTFSEGGYDNYLNNQRKALIDDYVVVRGEVPTLEETSIMVGDRNATLLHGYTWNGNDLVYVHLVNNINSGKSLIISIKNTSGESFKAKTDEILKSFVF